MISVWSSYGHRFMDDGGDGTTESCLTCGAVYYLRPVEGDSFTTHEYVTNAGMEPQQCTQDTGRVHGIERLCMSCHVEDDAMPCPHESHDCNCLLCA